MATPKFLETPPYFALPLPFLVNFFKPPSPISINFEKVEPYSFFSDSPFQKLGLKVVPLPIKKGERGVGGGGVRCWYCVNFNAKHFLIQNHT